MSKLSPCEKTPNMELVERIDPAEVLAHLKQMGYGNISPTQLKEFIKDLKKLILYDQLSTSSDSITSLSSSLTSDSEYFSSNESSSLSNTFEGSYSQQKDVHPPKHSKEPTQVKRPLHLSNAMGASVSSGSVMRRTSCSSSSLSGKTCSVQKENESQPCRERARTKSISSYDIQEVVKPRTSFIRPWQLQGTTTGQGRVGKSDPVSLYHYYQALWSRHKCPGEDSHADLRWVIRERMLGQDPHLYAPQQNALNPSRKHNRLRM